MNAHSLETGYVCAVDLGGTNLRAANIDRAGRIHKRVKTPTPKFARADEIVSCITAAVRECEEEVRERGDQLPAVSVVVPGSVHVETGAVINAPNLSSLQGYRLGAPWKQYLDGRSCWRMTQMQPQSARCGTVRPAIIELSSASPWGPVSEVGSFSTGNSGAGLTALEVRLVTPVSNRSAAYHAGAVT